MDTGALADAVREHRVVELVYSGDAAGTARLVQPHAVFRTTNGGLCLDGVQVAGPSSSRPLPAWKQFHLMKIIEVRVLDTRFVTAPDYDPRSWKYKLGLIASAA